MLSKTREDSSEQHFGRIKARIQGPMTLKAALLTTQLHHMQMRSKPPLPEDAAHAWGGMSDETASKLAQEALEAACSLRALCGVGLSAAEVETELRAWWEDVGQQALLMKAVPQETDEEPDGSDAEDEPEEGLEEGTDPAKALSDSSELRWWRADVANPA